jgi:hypothetical protein
MADLITRTRRLIGDPAGASATFDDQAIQDALDERSAGVFLEPLRPAPSRSGQLREYTATWGDWDGGVILEDAAGQQLAPATTDLLSGRWTFAQHTPACYLTGRTYDRYAAAADLLEAWAALAKLRVTASTGTKRVELSRQLPALLELAQTYRAKARPIVARLERADLADDVGALRDETGVTRLLGDLGTQYY